MATDQWVMVSWNHAGCSVGVKTDGDESFSFGGKNLSSLYKLTDCGLLFSFNQPRSAVFLCPCLSLHHYSLCLACRPVVLAAAAVGHVALSLLSPEASSRE